MDINTFNAVKTYGTAFKTPQSKENSPSPGKSGGAEFSAIRAAKDVAHSITKSENTAAAFMTGNADPHAVVEAMASAELAVETAVTIRDRVVEAYQELLRMPI